MQNEETTIRIKKTNKKRMAEIGRKDNSYDDILELLLEYYESNNKKKNAQFTEKMHIRDYTSRDPCPCVQKTFDVR